MRIFAFYNLSSSELSGFFEYTNDLTDQSVISGLEGTS
jgi:hypothetical protein